MVIVILVQPEVKYTIPNTTQNRIQTLLHTLMLALSSFEVLKLVFASARFQLPRGVIRCPFVPAQYSRDAYCMPSSLAS